MAVEIVHVAANLEPFRLGQGRRVDPRPGNDDHPQRRHALLRLRERVDHAPKQMRADARAADGDDADLLVRGIAELRAERLAVGEVRRGRSRSRSP